MAWPKGVPRKKVDSPESVTSAASSEPGELAATNIRVESDPFDKKLSHFQYDEGASYYEWERENPLEVPKEIRDANPQLEFRYRAIDKQSGTLKGGNEYHGWQVYKSGKHPEGIKVGGDLVLSAMPKDRAERYRQWVQARSTDSVKEVQESQISALDRAAAELQAKGVEYNVFQPGYEHESRGQKSYPVGISVGASKSKDKKTGRVVEQYRGHHPEELREMAAKAAEDRSKKRTYSYSGQTKRS